MKFKFEQFLLSVALAAPINLVNADNLGQERIRQSDSGSLETVVVYGKAYRTTGTKSDLQPMDAPMSFEVYDGELLQQRQADSVNEALRYVPGVTPENRGTVTIFDQYTIRGFQSYRNYYDGLVLQYNGLWNFAPQVDMFATESIEVLKGPTSVLYGSAPPGGMINQIAKQPLSSNHTHIRVRAGTQSLVELGVDHTASASDNLNYRVIALGRQQDGQMETTEEERRLFAPSVTWQLTEKTSLNINLYYQDDPNMLPSTPLPGEGTVLSAAWGELDSDAYAGDANWNNLDREFTMLGYKLNHEFADSLTFLQNFRYTDGDLFQRNTYHFSPAGQVLTRSAYSTDEEISGFTIDNQLAWEVSSDKAINKLLVGVDYQALDSDVQYKDTFATNTPVIDLADPDYFQFDRDDIESNFVYVQTNAIEQTQLGLYIQDEISWQSLTLLANLRRDIYESTDLADFGGAPGITEIDQEETTGRLAAIYTFESGWKPYINYASSYEPVAGTDSITGQAFKPTTAEQLEVGVKFASIDGNTQVTAAVFDITQENVVVNTPDFLQRTQRGEVTSKGFELALHTQVTDQLYLTASYNQQDVEVSENPLDPSLLGKTPVWVADKQASLWTTYSFTRALDLSLGARHVGESQLDAQNTGTVPSYTLADLAFSYRLNDNYRFGLTVSNLADKRYVGACFDRDNCWMGVERRAELSLYMDF